MEAAKSNHIKHWRAVLGKSVTFPLCKRLFFPHVIEQKIMTLPAKEQCPWR